MARARSPRYTRIRLARQRGYRSEDSFLIHLVTLHRTSRWTMRCGSIGPRTTDRKSSRTYFERERHCCSVANCLFAMRIFPERVPLEAETRVGKARFLFLCYVHFFFLYVCFGSSQTASVPRASVHMRSRSPFSASEDSRRRVGGRIRQSVFR